MEVPRSATDIDLRLFPVEDMEDEVAAETDTNLSETSSSELPEGTIPVISSTEQSQSDPPVKSTPDEHENKAPVILSPEQLSALATMLASALQHGTSANPAPSNLQLEQNSPLGLVSAALDLSAQASDTSTSDGRLTDLPSDAQGFSVLTAQAREALEWFRNVFGATFHNRVITKKNLSGIVERDDKFYENIFNLLDDNGNNVISLHEFAGGLHRLGRGRETPDRRITELTQVFLDESGPSGDLEKHEFITMCKKAKFAERLFGLFDLNDSGKVDYTKFMIGIDKLARSSKNMKWYTWAEKWFSKNASSDGRITKTQFLEYLNVSKSVFGERLFEVVDTDSSGSVDVTELMQVMYVLTQGSSKERLLLLFSIYDIDGDGTLSYEELKTVLRWCLSDSSFEEKEGLVEKLADILFEQIDIDKNGGVTQPEFEDFVNSYPKIADNITISLANCLRPRPKKKLISSEKFQRNVDRTLTYMRNNKPLIGYWFIYVSVNVILFMTAAANYWTNNNVFVVLARGPGSCLNFNSAFIVVLMFRHILTYLRSTWIGPYLPLDHSITAHKVTGAVIVGFSVIHTIMHVINFELLSNQTNVTWGEYLFTTQDGLGWVGGSACITGWVLVVVLAAIAVTSLPCLRRRGYFQLFYWSHWLFIGWWVTLVIHAPHFWKWLIGPATIYVLEKLWRHTRGRAMSLTAIRSIRAVDSKVSEVIIERPRGLKFSAGDYIFINIEDIAQFEWHPFTVSSAPEQTEYISLHIQAVGDWTKRLRALGETKTAVSRLNSVNSNVSTYVVHNKAPVLHNGGKAHPAVQRTTSLPTWNPDYKKPNYMRSRSIEEKQRDHTRDIEANNANSLVGLRAWIDGPYGSPSTTVYDVDHAIMIAAGIGVTPFASILQSIMFRQRRKRAICPKCSHIWKLVNDDGVVSVPKKVDFIWVTRTFSALEWFLGVLGELEEEQALLKAKDRFMNLNLHVTSALVQSDIRAVALQMALELCYQEEARDPLCGLRTRIQPGRPNWRKLFEKMLRKTQGRVCVFYCGPPQLEKALKKICTEYNLDFRAENF